MTELLNDWTTLGQQLGAWLLELGLILVLMFWMVGAYNRLMRHRGSVNAAWVQIDDLLVRRAAALDTLLAAATPALAAEAHSLQALRQAHETQRQAALAVRPKPTRNARLKTWVAAERDLASPLARLHALLDQHSALADDDTVKPARRTLGELGQRLQYARQSFNDAADAYNTAVGEFPTRLLTRLFGFGRVQRL